MIERIRNLFGSRFEPELLSEIIDAASLSTLKEGTDLIKPGQYIKTMPLLLSGRINIHRVDEEGRELLLYFLQPGQTCSISLTCAIHEAKSTVHATTEEDSEMITVPIQKMTEWMERYRTWRQFVIENHQHRFDELIESIDSIAFQNMDQRLIRFLNKEVNAHQSNTIEMTHSEIATKLNTSRVVVSRLLKKLESAGKLDLGRNQIVVRKL